MSFSAMADVRYQNRFDLANFYQNYPHQLAAQHMRGRIGREIWRNVLRRQV
jgi:hypothetical protein